MQDQLVSNNQTFSIATGVLDGLLDRNALACQLKVTSRTLIRYEHAGMPVIVMGAKRLYDPTKVRAWLMSHERNHDAPKRGRPAGKRAA